ncbi:hypothetical protein DSECCO2_436560 [anaerobic digester metagenome]
MASTKAQRSAKGRKNYGKNYSRGRKAENKAAKELRKQGYSVKVTKGSRGPADVIARKGNAARRIQVKSIESRTITSTAAARRRVKGKPFNVPAGRETWVYNGKKTHKFKT